MEKFNIELTKKEINWIFFACNDYIPVQLIATPGADDSPRYGSRPFTHIYPKGDNIVIEYDNRAPEVLVTGDVYDMHDEKIDICFNGKIYPIL